MGQRPGRRNRPAAGQVAAEPVSPATRIKPTVLTMETLVIALAAFIPMLLLLVVVHELGHFWTAKAFGVKVLEFGVGYPPRVWGVYTGRTETLLTGNTVCLNGAVQQIRPGMVVRVLSGETAAGQLEARYVEVRDSRTGGSILGALGRFAGAGGQNQNGDTPARASLDELQSDRYLRHEGRVREVQSDRIVLADMVYSVNWLPLGGFVRLSGENNPEAPRSLARRGLGQRAIVLAAGSAMNAIFPDCCIRHHPDDSPHRAGWGDRADNRHCSGFAGRGFRADGRRPGAGYRRANAGGAE